MHKAIVLSTALALSSPVISRDGEINPADYALKVEVSAPTISWTPDRSHGTWFIIDRTKGLIMTAAHVIPSVLPALKDGVLTVEGKPAKLICLDGEHDLAILQTTIPSGKKEPILSWYNPKIGDFYKSALQSDKGMTFPVQHSENWDSLEIPMILNSVWTVISISTAIKRIAWWESMPSKTEILITDKPSKPGFSGWPAITASAELVGVQIRVDTSFGILSSIKNVRELIWRKECKVSE